MKKVKHLFSGMLAVLAVLLLTDCQWNENPVRTSLDILQTDLTLQVGESATRAASTESKDYEFIYTSSNPTVAIVDQTGKVTAMSEGTATITVTMPETKIGWYAAATRQYKVIVNKVSAAALVDVDKSTPLTLVAAEDGKITVTFNNGVTLKNDIHYTINGGAEQTIAKNTEGSYDITVKKGDVVQFYSINTSLGGSAVASARGFTRAVDSSAKYINIKPSMKTEIYGNVMSLLKGKDNLESATTIEANNAFYGLFAGAEKLVNNAERLLVLPATTLKEGCYQDMFNGCKGIEKAPELPAPKLEKNCYQEMFYDCAKLNHVKCLASDITAEGSTKDWLGKAGTEATGEKVLETLVDMTPNSDDGVPASWTPKKIILVESVTLGKTELELIIGQADVTLTATVKPDDATDKTVTWTSDKPAVATVDANGKVHAVAAGEATITAQAGDKKATCAVTVTAAPQNIIDLSTVTTATTIEDGYTVTGTLGANVKVSIADGATVTLDGVSINADGTWTTGTYAGITCAGSATIILKDGSENTVKGFYERYPGIHVPSEMTLTIKGETNGTGKLTASSNGNGAGIGGGRYNDCGNIEIQGGDITATGSSYAAGIGGAGDSSCGTITISGGTITATGGDKGAGIGSGYCSSCGNITITTGVTKVTATKGASATNSIGAGASGTCGTVTIGGVVGAITTSPYTYPTPFVALSAVTSSQKGWRICSDGKAYAAGPLPTGVTAVAMIAYVGNDTGHDTYKHGLALALTDESGGNIMNWDDAKTACEGKNTSIPITNSTWLFASQDQWNNIISGAGGYEALRDGFSGVGGSNLQTTYKYWSSSETTAGDNDAGRTCSFYDGTWGATVKSNNHYARAALAF